MLSLVELVVQTLQMLQYNFSLFNILHFCSKAELRGVMSVIGLLDMQTFNARVIHSIFECGQAQYTCLVLHLCKSTSTTHEYTTNQFCYSYQWRLWSITRALLSRIFGWSNVLNMHATNMVVCLTALRFAGTDPQPHEEKNAQHDPAIGAS